MRPNIRYGPAALLLLALTLTVACFIPACGTLDKSGPYGGDKVLYDADVVLDTSYTIIHEFVSWEAASRPALAAYPEITKAADVLRDEAPKAFATAMMFRDSYERTPNAGTRDAFQASVAVVKSFAAEARKYLMAQQAPKAAFTPLKP